jgi:drug/metabolite transporter (DMT)-like permease
MLPRTCMQDGVVVGIGLMLIGTLCATGADASLKAVASNYAAPQILLIAAVLSIVLSFAANFGSDPRRVLRTGAPVAMAVRSLATVIAAVGFYQAFVRLHFAEVFLFIGLMPLLAAAFSGPILGESVGRRVWLGLAVGFAGLLLLAPAAEDFHAITGYLFAAMGSLSGTISVVLSRRISRSRTHSLAQVVFPQAAVAVVMAACLPFTYAPMNFADVSLVVLYSVLLFSGRWILVIVARLIPAWLSMQMMNLQFVWMALLGVYLFNEPLTGHAVSGAALVALAAIVLSFDVMKRDAPPIIAEAALSGGGRLQNAAMLVRIAASAGR